MKAHLIDTHILVPRSRSSAKVKVKYQGHVSQKMGVLGALVFHKYILFKFKRDQRPYILDEKQLQPSVGIRIRCPCSIRILKWLVCEWLKMTLMHKAL